jgi:hypothetical protein
MNPKKAQLIRKNRSTGFVYDDEDKLPPIKIDVIPYNVNQAISYGIDTDPEASGYFIVRWFTDIKEGDQIIYQNKKYSVIKVKDNWIFNKIESIEVIVK